MQRTRVALVLLLVVAGILRAALLTGTRENAFLEIDGGDYYDIASNLAQGDGFAISYYRWFEPRPDDTNKTHPDLYRPPLLPLLGSGLLRLPGDWIAWAMIGSLLLGVAAILMLYLLVRSLFGSSVALLAAALWTTYPYAIYYSARWSTENLLTLCTLSGLVLLSLYRSRGRLSLVVATGVCLGLATLARPNALLIPAALGFWLLKMDHRHRKVIVVMAFFCGLALPLTPWSVRNLRLTGVATPTTLFAPYNIWLGMNDRIYQMYQGGESDEFITMDHLYRVESQHHVRHLEQMEIFDPIDVNTYWLALCSGYIRERPERALNIVGHRLLHFFRPWPNRLAAGPHVFWISLLSVGPIMFFALVSLIFRRETRHWLILLPMLVSLAGSLPFVFHLRFRYPVFDPLMIVLASPTITAVIKAAAKRCSGSMDGAHSGQHLRSPRSELPQAQPPP